LNSYSEISLQLAQKLEVGGYKLWGKIINERGCTFGEVEKLGCPGPGLLGRPVDFVVYDDKSDVGTTVKLAEKLILEDKVDMLLAPWGTAANMAVAPITHKYGYPFILISCSSEKLREVIHTLPNCVAILNQPRDQGGDLVELLEALAVPFLVRHPLSSP
jgi:branched-chain amino acid transport system substrate-binding protein